MLLIDRQLEGPFFLPSMAGRPFYAAHLWAFATLSLHHGASAWDVGSDPFFSRTDFGYELSPVQAWRSRAEPECVGTPHVTVGMAGSQLVFALAHADRIHRRKVQWTGHDGGRIALRADLFARLSNSIFWPASGSARGLAARLADKTAIFHIAFSLVAVGAVVFAPCRVPYWVPK